VTVGQSPLIRSGMHYGRIACLSFGVVALVCYQTQLITAGLRYLPISCCLMFSGGEGVRTERGCSAFERMITTVFQSSMRQTLDPR
jgi:hypothetical protein